MQIYKLQTSSCFMKPVLTIFLAFLKILRLLKFVEHQFGKKMDNNLIGLHGRSPYQDSNHLTLKSRPQPLSINHFFCKVLSNENENSFSFEFVRNSFENSFNSFSTFWFFCLIAINKAYTSRMALWRINGIFSEWNSGNGGIPEWNFMALIFPWPFAMNPGAIWHPDNPNFPNQTSFYCIDKEITRYLYTQLRYITFEKIVPRNTPAKITIVKYFPFFSFSFFEENKLQFRATF